MRNSRSLARHAEALGFTRFWMAEHHNMPGVASAATAVCLGYVAEGTRSIRVGAGGIMLPNHAPLVIAEQFGTLASLYPGRIDLGLGRAPGTDMRTTQSLRRTLNGPDNFPQDVQELQAYFQPVQPGQAVRAVPGAGLEVPIWLLGSSLYSAQLAALLGLPFAFAAHFAPDHLEEAFAIYRQMFKPSAVLDKPYAMVCIGVFGAETDREAQRLFTSQQQQFINLRTGRPGPLPPPVDDLSTIAPPDWIAALDSTFRYAAVGSPSSVKAGIERMIDLVAPNEIMAAAQIFDHAARLQSYSILAEVTGLAPLLQDRPPNSLSPGAA